MRVTLLILTLSLLLAAPAAGLAQNKVDQQMFAELRMLQEQVQQLRLAVNALADSVKGAQQRAYEVVHAIRFDGAQYRRDIGHRAVRDGGPPAGHSLDRG